MTYADNMRAFWDVLVEYEERTFPMLEELGPTVPDGVRAKQMVDAKLRRTAPEFWARLVAARIQIEADQAETAEAVKNAHRGWAFVSDVAESVERKRPPAEPTP